LKLDGLHGVISQKMILFITTAVKTSNPTYFITYSESTKELLLEYLYKKKLDWAG
jgi:hypothetical protein